MVSEVERLITRLKLEGQGEYITDMEKIMSYGMMSTPILVIDEQVLMIDHCGAEKIEAVL